LGDASNRGLVRALLILSALQGVGGMLYFLFLNVTCFVLWGYGLLLLPFSYVVHRGAVGPRLARRIFVAVLLLSIVAPWPYLRWTDRVIDVEAGVSALDGVGPCECARFVVEEDKLWELTGFKVEGKAEWELCEEGLAQWLRSSGENDTIETKWEITYASEYLASWQLYSYGLKRVGDRDALAIMGSECSE
jgi:hypothetical protein